MPSACATKPTLAKPIGASTSVPIELYAAPGATASAGASFCIVVAHSEPQKLDGAPPRNAAAATAASGAATASSASCGAASSTAAKAAKSGREGRQRTATALPNIIPAAKP